MVSTVHDRCGHPRAVPPPSLDLAPVLRALGNDERLLILLWLAGSSCSVRDLQRVTGLWQSNVSYHLQALREAGLVTATARGRSNHYQLANPHLDQLSGLIGNLGTPAQPIETNGQSHD
jgi:DNA-binding transcriptional ArsR family regulator